MATAAEKKRTRGKANLRLVPKSQPPAKRAPASRPVLLESEVFRKEARLRLEEVEGQLNLMAQAAIQAENDFQARLAHEQGKRDAERGSHEHRWADLMRVRDGLAAALDASAEPQHMPAEQTQIADNTAA